MIQDIRYAWRLMLRSKAFALIAILTLSLGIGATTAVFSIVDGVLRAPAGEKIAAVKAAGKPVALRRSL